MTSKEVKSEVEGILSPFYPSFTDSEELREAINQAVSIAAFELGIPQGMAVNHVKHIVWSYRHKLENDDE